MRPGAFTGRKPWPAAPLRRRRGRMPAAATSGEDRRTPSGVAAYWLVLISISDMRSASVL